MLSESKFKQRLTLLTFSAEFLQYAKDCDWQGAELQDAICINKDILNNFTVAMVMTEDYEHTWANI